MKVHLIPRGIIFLLFTVTLIILPLVGATSVVNIGGMDLPKSLIPVSSQHAFSQSFTTQGDGTNLSTIVLPLTRWYTLPTGDITPGYITVEIRPVMDTVDCEPDLAAFPITQGFTNAYGLIGHLSDGYGANGTSTAADIVWVCISVTPTYLAPSTTYALVVRENLTDVNVGYYWWASEFSPIFGTHSMAYECNLAGGFSFFNGTAFGFELIEESNTYVGVMLNAQLFLSLFLSLGMGVIGFGMTKGKEPLAAIFMIEFGVLISFLLGWLPSWILAASFAVLGIVLAYRFRGAISHG